MLARTARPPGPSPVGPYSCRLQAAVSIRAASQILSDQSRTSGKKSRCGRSARLPRPMAGEVEAPEDRHLLQLPEGQRRTHPRDLFLVAGPPPARGDPDRRPRRRSPNWPSESTCSASPTMAASTTAPCTGEGCSRPGAFQVPERSPSGPPHRFDPSRSASVRTRVAGRSFRPSRWLWRRSLMRRATARASGWSERATYRPGRVDGTGR